MTDYSAYCVEISRLFRAFEQCAREEDWSAARVLVSQLCVKAIELSQSVHDKEGHVQGQVAFMDREPLESPDD